MKPNIPIRASLSLVTLLFCVSLEADEQNIPEPFRGATPGSAHEINYGDLNELLEVMVVDVGRSSREILSDEEPRTGTRMKSSRNKYTATEGNRFNYEAFEDNENFQQALERMRLSLEQIPSQASLSYFSGEEQLAYWINLYNVTMLNEIVKIYPKKYLKKYVSGKKSIKSQKILNVAGVPLSLSDIQYAILSEKYNNDPLIMYGLYQGVIGGPNIREEAYTGANVYRLLKDNATEFVNSNRGTRSYRNEFKVSSLYETNEQYFPSFDQDLKAHLMAFIQGYEKEQLMAVNKLKPSISDWTVTDIYGTHREYGGHINNNGAGLIGASDNNVPESGFIDTGSGSEWLVGKPDNTGRLSPELTALIEKIRENDAEAVMDETGRVTVTEIYALEPEDIEDE